jgi:hypothetical protein
MQIVAQGDSVTPLLKHDFEHDFSAFSFVIIFYFSVFLGVTRKSLFWVKLFKMPENYSMFKNVLRISVPTGSNQ